MHFTVCVPSSTPHTRYPLHMSKPVIITSQPTQKVVAELLGVKYEVSIPKKALLLAVLMKLKSGGSDPIALMDAVDIIIKKIFGADLATEVHDRLADADDDLDIDHILELANVLIATATGNPTT